MTAANQVGMSLQLEEIAGLGENLSALATMPELVLYISERRQNQYSLPVKTIATAVKVAHHKAAVA